MVVDDTKKRVKKYLPGNEDDEEYDGRAIGGRIDRNVGGVYTADGLYVWTDFSKEKIIGLIIHLCIGLTNRQIIRPYLCVNIALDELSGKYCIRHVLTDYF